MIPGGRLRLSVLLGRWNPSRLPAALAALLALLLAWPVPRSFAADAEEAIELRWELGFQSVYKEGEYTRLLLTLTNRAGRDLRGDVVLAYDDGFPKEIAVPAELPRDTPVVVEMTVPGMIYSKTNNEIRFYEGGAGSGRRIELKGSTPYLNGTGVHSTLIGVVARDPDTMNFLALLSSRGYDIRTVALKEEELPADALRLETLDMLVLNDAATGSWPQEKIDAIRSWIIRGGKLIVSGGAGYAKTAAAFADLVPVAPGGTAVLESAPILEAIGGGPFDPGTPITVSTGELQAGTVTLADGVPVAAVRPYGAGSVLYAAFDPSVEPFAGWSGTPLLWERILSDAGLQPGVMNVYYGYGYNFWNYDSVLSYFPSLKPPKIGSLSLFFIVYVLLAAPVLYLVLKRLDRREWMWWIIPVLSVACSVVIFAAGSGDKRTEKAHSARIVQLAGDGWADRTAAAAVFVPSGGTVSASFDGAGFAVPLRDDELVQSGFEGLKGSKVARMSDREAEAEWRNVPYWSIRKAWVHLGASSGYGRFDATYAYDGQLLNMTVTNNTAADLTHVHVLMNQTAYSVGDLKRGASGTVRIPYNGGGPGVGFGLPGYQVFPLTHGDDPHVRERGLLDAYVNDVRSRNSVAPMIIGFSTDGEGWFEVNGSEVPSDNVTLWVQPVDMTVVDALAGVPRIVQPVVTESSLREYANSPYEHRMEMADGTIRFEYPLPWRDEPHSALTVIQSEPVTTEGVTLSVWNEAAGAWEEVPMNAVSYKLPGPAESYVTERRTVRMQLAVAGRIMYRLPDLKLEGGVSE